VPEVEYDLAILYELTNRYDQAMQCYQKVIQLAPESGDAEKSMYRVAVCFSELHKFQESIEVFDQFMEKYPNSQMRDLAQRRRAAIWNR